MSHHIAFTRVSSNAKTGPIPVTTTSEETCPVSCPLKRNGCYADAGPLALFWRKHGWTPPSEGMPPPPPERVMDMPLRRVR